MRALLSLLLAATAAPALAGARQEATVIMPENAEARRFLEDYGFSEAIVSGDTVYLSGVVVGAPREGTALEPAFEATFRLLGDILKRAGVTWDDVVDITSYHTDVVPQVEAMKTVKNRYVKAPFPAWTAIGVSRLLPERGITEIKLVAKLPKKQ
jgi:enamine deaminase RidA (YjgF/YER057c/UK114 family)